MTSRSFDDRLDRLQWTPGVVPSNEVIDSILGGTANAGGRSLAATLGGAIAGILTGFGVKGMTLVGSPWGPDTGMTGLIGGGASLAALAVSILLAFYVVFRGKQKPRLMQFASMNLLMIVVLLLA
ncbi:hypothetical protein [Roseobacter sp. SK209-2-6]|uniref:hypothetical protein n=1 Tax=Roseobacter sp. SK209-2-6 TaxID=388739 RepID=UPI000303E788|nr:hypothetical protein [Roseobacter sp. SK209-2-6]